MFIFQTRQWYLVFEIRESKIIPHPINCRPVTSSRLTDAALYIDPRYVEHIAESTTTTVQKYHKPKNWYRRIED
jgi:hypothetical protein